MLLLLLLCTAFLSMMCSIVDGMLQLSYVWVFAPLYILEGILAFQSILHLRSKPYDADRTGDCVLGRSPVVLHVLLKAAARALLVLLVPLRLDGVVHYSWTFIFLPAWLLLVLQGASACVSLRGASVVRESTDREAVNQTMALLRMCAVVALAWLLLTLLLRLEHVSTTWLSVFAPFFMAAAMYFSCCCCICTVLIAASDPKPREVPQTNLPASASVTDIARCERDPLLGQAAYCEFSYGSEGLAAAV
jgi:hypothetical protein